ncbi:hypothetical protein PT310_03285 [Metamycoplasma hyosynoviae]|uniref:hypothetical protein n=2 Tax=Metamycoplasma hyosynoviae TaxID=29559 RepID=UPI002361134D|nr:hypothetical protein [Metamycoplasma hyosynoviae]MDD1378635.1 hypothetical protein [Metamycoplasma hyosynoviae]
MNKKILFGVLGSLTLFPITLVSTSTVRINKKIDNKEKSTQFNKKQSISSTKTKYVIKIDGKEMIFDSKDEIVKYLVEKVNVNHFIGKKELKDFDGQIDMDPNKLNPVDFSKIKRAYKDIHGNYTDDLSSVIRSYLPEFAIVKRYYDHRNQPFKDEEDAKNSIIKNSTEDIVENIFYKLKYSSNGITKDKYYNPLNENDINELMHDIYHKNVLAGETKILKALHLKDENGNEKLLSYKGSDGDFFSNLFTNAIKDFTNQAVKRQYKVTLKLPRMDDMKKYDDYGKAYFESFSSNNDNEWIVNNDKTELYKHVDEEWLKKYYYDLEVLKNSEIANKFVNNNFKREYSKRIEEVENPNYGKGGGRHRGPHAGPKPSESKYIKHTYWDHLAKLKGSFLDFKNLTLIAKQFKPDNYYITVFDKDKWTYNNFGVEINVEFDKENFKNKINNLKNKFDESPEKLKMFQSLLINTIKKLNVNQKNKDEAEKYFENQIIDPTIWNMLYDVFKNELNKFIENVYKNNDRNYSELKFSDLQTHYKNDLDNNWDNWVNNLNLTSVFNILDIKLTLIKEITYYNANPTFYIDNKNRLINLSNKIKINNNYFDLVNPNEKINETKIMNVQNTIKEQNNFSLIRKIDYMDDYSNYFNLEGLQTFKFKNFIQYKETKNNSLVYQLNNSYSQLTTFKDDAEIADYLRKIKIDGIKPIARYIIVGLESTLSSHGIKMLFNELGFNDPSTITNNYRAILQKLILPSTEKIFYVNNGHKYLMDLKYFNLWNIELNNEKYYFANSRDVTKFIIKYVNLNAKPIIRNGVK